MGKVTQCLLEEYGDIGNVRPPVCPKHMVNDGSGFFRMVYITESNNCPVCRAIARMYGEDCVRRMVC